MRTGPVITPPNATNRERPHLKFRRMVLVDSGTSVAPLDGNVDTRFGDAPPAVMKLQLDTDMVVSRRPVRLCRSRVP